jgi:hypothetical protein
MEKQTSIITAATKVRKLGFKEIGNLQQEFVGRFRRL